MAKLRESHWSYPGAERFNYTGMPDFEQEMKAHTDMPPLVKAVLVARWLAGEEVEIPMLSGPPGVVRVRIVQED